MRAACCGFSERGHRRLRAGRCGFVGVTEFGIADLYGKNLRQRAAALIRVADPRHRDALAAEARRRFGTW